MLAVGLLGTLDTAIYTLKSFFGESTTSESDDEKQLLSL